MKYMSNFDKLSVEEVHEDLLADFNDLPGLDIFLNSILSLRDSEFYFKAITAYNMEEPYEASVDRGKMVRRQVKEVLFYKMANENLSHFPFRIVSITGLIDFTTFSTLSILFEFLYYRDSGVLLGFDVLSRLDSGFLDERVVFALDDFDKVSSVPEPTVDFFKRLRRMKWQDKRTKKLFEKIMDLQKKVFYEKWDSNNSLPKFKDGSFREIKIAVFEERILLTLAGCSAANNDRVFMCWDDIKTAYKTYFKLLNSDLTNLV